MLVTLLITCVVCASGDATPRTMDDYARVHGAGANMNVPRWALSRDDLRRWARIINASEAQEQFMGIMYERFVERHNAFMDREAPEYLRQSRELNELMQQNMSDRAFLRAQRRVDEANLRMIRELTSIEHGLIVELEPVLSEEQIERLPILRNEAQRRNCRVYLARARWSRIELRDVWEGLVSEIDGPDVREAAETTLAEYEAALTPLICRWAEAFFLSRRQLTEHRIRVSERGDPGYDGRRRVEQIMSGIVEVAVGIRSLHEKTLERVRRDLPPEIADEFVRAAKEAAFPEIYPDPYAIHAVFEAIAADEEVDDDARFGVTVLAGAYAADYAGKCRELEEFAIDYAEKGTAGKTGHSPHLFREFVRPLLKERDATADEYAERLAKVVGEEIVMRHLTQRESRASLPIGESPAVRRAIEEQMERLRPRNE